MRAGGGAPCGRRACGVCTSGRTLQWPCVSPSRIGVGMPRHSSRWVPGSGGNRSGLGVGQTFVTCQRNFPFVLLHNNTATFAKVSQKFQTARNTPTATLRSTLHHETTAPHPDLAAPPLVSPRATHQHSARLFTTKPPPLGARFRAISACCRSSRSD